MSRSSKHFYNKSSLVALAPGTAGRRFRRTGKAFRASVAVVECGDGGAQGGNVQQRAGLLIKATEAM